VSVKYSLAHIAFKPLYVPPGRSGGRILTKVRDHQDPLFNAYRGSFQGTNLPGREVQHSPLSSVEVKHEWRYTSAPPECRHGVHEEIFYICASATQ